MSTKHSLHCVLACPLKNVPLGAENNSPSIHKYSSKNLETKNWGIILR